MKCCVKESLDMCGMFTFLRPNGVLHSPTPCLSVIIWRHGRNVMSGYRFVLQHIVSDGLVSDQCNLPHETDVVSDGLVSDQCNLPHETDVVSDGLVSDQCNLPHETDVVSDGLVSDQCNLPHETDVVSDGLVSGQCNLPH